MFDISYDKGQTIDYIDFSHPFSAYLKNKPSWEAYIPRDSCAGWRILASVWETHVVSLTKKIGKGHIVLLPSSYHYQNGELVERCIKELLGDKEPSQIPSWATPILVPGQQEVLSELGGVEAKIEELGKERSKLVAKNEDLERWKWLLYETGKHRLEPVVRDALSLLNCEVVPQPDEASDGLVKCEYGTALLEIEGAKETVKIDKVAQLIINMGNSLATRREVVKGILVGNPFREETPANRPPKDSQKQLFSRELLETAENQNIAVLLSSDLYEVICRLLLGQLSDAEKQSFRQRIFTDKGLIRLI